MEIKDRIIESALQQFLRRGIRSITMARLIDSLGISTKTVYKYFKGKRELLQACLDLHYSRQVSRMTLLEKENNNPVSLLLALFQSALKEDFGVSYRFYQDLNRYYPALQDRAIEKQAEVYRTFFWGIMEKGVTQGYFTSDLHPEIAIAGLEILYHSITRSRKFSPFKLSPEDLFFALPGTYIRGICTFQGLSEFEKIKQKPK